MNFSTSGAAEHAEDRQDIFAALIETISEPIFVIEPQSGRILETNPAAAACFGISNEDLVSRTIESIFPGCEKWLLADSGILRAEACWKGSEGLSVPFNLTGRCVSYFGCPAILLFARESAAREDLVETNLQFPSIIGQSAQIREACRLIGLVAPTDATVLIQGESGTGKELVAQAVHFHSRRSNRPLIKVNCAALSETLLESELFGHKKGAFTGAVADRKGRFKLADGGTIILDEVDSLSLAGQAKLLRVLQEEEFEAVGDSTTLRVDVRVIAMTNADLGDAIREGRFREDLFYRLNAFPIRLAPLRERREDIPLLVRHFLKTYSASLHKRIDDIDLRALTMLTEYPWPGNIRELENCIEYAAILESSGVLSAGSLPDKLRGREPEVDSSLKARLAQAERQILLETLSLTNGVKKRAATLLGIDRRNFSYFLHKHGIQ